MWLLFEFYLSTDIDNISAIYKIYSRIGDAGNINISYSSVVDIFG